MKKLAIITTHPIQYNAPLFALLTARGRVELKVFYTWGEDVLKAKYDPGFQRVVNWDIPLLEGYNYAFVKNTAAKPGSHHFRGIDNPTLNAEIVQWGADAVLIYGWSFKSHFKAIRFFYGRIPVLFRGDSTFVTVQSGLKTFLRKRFLKFVYRHVDYCLYVGTNNRRYYELCSVPERKLIFAPHAVDNARFKDTRGEYQQQADAMKSEMGIPREAVTLLFAGKLTEDKNAQLLIKSMDHLSSLPYPHHLIIVGNGPYEQELKAIAGGNPNIHFLPFQNQAMMPVVYRLGDIFIMPTKISDTWGLAINEAMASGRPVLVSSSCGAAIDLVKDGRNGYVFDSRNEDDFLEKLIKLCINKSLCANMGAGSLQIIGDWSLEKIAEKVELLAGGE